MKNVYKKNPKANLLSDEKLKLLPQKLGKRKKSPLALLFNILLKILSIQ
jgi:hypothetical protein